MTETSRAYGRCPNCGRVIAGRADGIQRGAAARTWVLLAPHSYPGRRRRTVVCLPRGARLRVPRIPPTDLAKDPAWLSPRH